MDLKRLILVVGLFLLPSIGQSRVVQIWSYADLVGKADAVVIAVPTSVNESTAIVPFPGLWTTDMKGETGPLGSHEVETTFNVRAVLKGSGDVKKFVLLHYVLAIDDASKPIVDGPGVLSFEPKDKKSFLMFLKKEEGGRFSAVSGQADPEFSVRLIGPS
jgi:hypothetical protein